MSAPFTSPPPWTHRANGGAETIVDRHGRTVAILVRGMEPGNGAVIAASPALRDALRLAALVISGETTNKADLITALERSRDALKLAGGNQ